MLRVIERSEEQYIHLDGNEVIGLHEPLQVPFLGVVNRIYDVSR